MQTKILTINCKKCKKFTINDTGNMFCSWGHKTKRLIEQKSNNKIECKLKR